jgi:hypothetical protein
VRWFHLWHLRHLSGSFLHFSMYTFFWHTNRPFTSVSLAEFASVNEKIRWPQVCEGFRLAIGLIHLAFTITPPWRPLHSSISWRSVVFSDQRVSGVNWTTMWKSLGFIVVSLCIFFRNLSWVLSLWIHCAASSLSSSISIPPFFKCVIALILCFSISPPHSLIALLTFSFIVAVDLFLKSEESVLGSMSIRTCLVFMPSCALIFGLRGGDGVWCSDRVLRGGLC